MKWQPAWKIKQKFQVFIAAETTTESPWVWDAATNNWVPRSEAGGNDANSDDVVEEASQGSETEVGSSGSKVTTTVEDAEGKKGTF